MTIFSRLTAYTFIFLVSFTFFQASAKETKVIMYGDSVSAGYGMTLNESWPHLLQQTFISENTPIKLINESISGETTGGGLSRIKEVLSRNEVGNKDWIIIELGGNDGLRGFPIKTLKNNLVGLIEQAQFQGVNVALMQVKIPPNYGRRYTTLFEGQYQKLAEQYNLPLLPFFMEQVATNPDYMMKDGIHPNKSAQVIIRDFMKPIVEQLVLN